MELWKKTWREGIAPALATEALDGLRACLEADSPQWVQGATTVPPNTLVDPVSRNDLERSECMAACAVGLAGMASGLKTVGEVEDHFAAVCHGCDERTGEPGSSRRFTTWHDEIERAEARRLLMDEIDRELAERRKAVPA